MAPGDRLAGLNRFKLIVGENLVETQQLVMTAAREAHVLLQDHRLVRVQINDWPEQLFHFSNLLDDEYTEAAGQAPLRIVTYDYPDDSVADKALVYTDSPHYRDNTFDFPEHFRRAMAQLETPPDDWEPLLRRYSDFNTAIRGDSAADPAEFFDLEYLGRFEAIRYVLGLDGHGFILNNLRVFLNTANGKFYPALGRDDIPSTLDLSDSRTLELELNNYDYQGRNPPDELPMFHFVARSDRVRQAIYRAVYRFIVQGGARLVGELEQGRVEGGSLAPAELAIVRSTARAGSGTDAASVGSGVTVGRGGIACDLDVEHAVTPPVSGAIGTRVFGAVLAREDPARDTARFHGRVGRQAADDRRAGRRPEGGHPGQGAGHGGSGRSG